MRSRLACERKQVGVDCVDPEAICAGHVDRVADLVFGGAVVDPAVGRNCRKALVVSSRKYLQKRIRDLVFRGRREVPWGSRFVKRIVRHCATPGEPALEALGGECAAFATSDDSLEAAHCLRGALEQVAQEVTGIDIRPNILLVLTDDQRADSMSVMPLTRALVGARGIEFTESFVSTSLCCPDRASILTGLYAHNHGVLSNAGAHAFDHEGETIARRLQEGGGYRTALLGKYMVGTGDAIGAAVPPGWSQWHVFQENGNDGSGRLYYNYTLSENGTLRQYGSDVSDYSTDLLAARATGLMASWAARPWFIELALYAPHPGAVPAVRHLGAFAGLPPHRPPSWLEPDVTGKPQWVGAQTFIVANTPAEPAATDTRRLRELEALLAVDEAVALVSDQLEARGLTDNTMLLYTSDNGVLWLEHWLRLKNYPYEEAVRVPLLLRYPKLVHEPRQEPRFVQSIDFYPTFAELADVEGAAVNGTSLLPLLRNDAVPWRQDILLEHFVRGAMPSSQALRTHDWKLIETDAPSGITTELYDMNADPYELDNLADEPANAGLIGQMRVRLQQLVAE